jgi:hypothetical protein
MRIARGALQLGLGLGLILHGLGTAVYPLRGIDAAAPGEWVFALTILYIVSIGGFVAAGLGVLGTRPLVPFVIPLSINAGLAALASHLWLRDGDLWLGVVFSIALPAIAIWWARYFRREPWVTRCPRWRAVGDAIGLGFLAWIGAATLLWPYTRTWGTAPDEWAITLPGDHTPRTPALEIFHGVTIDAPPTAVWPWLVQLGQDRAGFYSYDRLERLFGADVRNVSELRPEWQARRAGDRIFAAAQGSYWERILHERPGWNVTVVEPNQALVLENWGAFVLIPQSTDRTRFVIRSTISNRAIPVWAAAINFSAFELPHFIMQRRMMLRIKELAEGGAEVRG